MKATVKKKRPQNATASLLFDSLLVDVGAGHGVFVVLLVDEYVLLVRIDVALLRDADDVADGDDVNYSVHTVFRFFIYLQKRKAKRIYLNCCKIIL